jgi:peptidoglycan/LPS O-acetylase OafA/YrhL
VAGAAPARNPTEPPRNLSARHDLPPPVPRYAGLDGLRALAVVLVVVYHLFPGWVLHSGFVGVDVFFVISGFLITSLLLREHDRTGRIALLAFWTRRARRLLPALAVVVTVSASVAWLVGGDVLLGLGRQVLGAITFSSNWASISAGASYFAGTQPELLRNLWSLAVEEQFYVLWPLLLPVFLLPTPRHARRRRRGPGRGVPGMGRAARGRGVGIGRPDARVLRHRYTPSAC